MLGNQAFDNPGLAVKEHTGLQTQAVTASQLWTQLQLWKYDSRYSICQVLGILTTQLERFMTQRAQAAELQKGIFNLQHEQPCG